MLEQWSRTTSVSETQRTACMQAPTVFLGLGSKRSVVLPSLTSVKLALLETRLVGMNLKMTLANSVPAKQ